MFDVIKQFFILGLMSFGGPAAHIGYFHKQFVIDQKWLSEEEFASIVAISHLLPGPGSSQVGFAIGYHRAGLLGAISAFIGFTLPSFVLMIALAYFGNAFNDNAILSSVIHGLKLLAVIVVADAIWGMFNNFCKNKLTQALCIATAIAILLFQSISVQMLAIVAAGIIGYRYLSESKNTDQSQYKLELNLPVLAMTTVLFGASFLVYQQELLSVFFSYFQAGSLVYGGGHVVLPLLQNLTQDVLDSDTFLTGYALAQGVPGPMFTLATFLGYNTTNEMPLLGATLATLGIFLPGFLLLCCFKSSWDAVSSNPTLKGITAGINASVVGLLIAAFYQPIFTSAVGNASDFAVILIGLLALKSQKLSILKLILVVLIFNFLLMQLPV
ncbi:MAG: chromate efflux transporter [Psychrobium sp.]